MEQSKKQFNILVSLVLLILAVACVVNVSYSYFTSASTTGGSVDLKDLNVEFYYTLNGSDVSKGTDTLELYSASGTIAREQEFELSLTEGGEAIDDLGIRVASGSCPVYIRLWIDAYIIKQDNSLDTTVNYGKYFLLAQNNYCVKTNGSVANSNCYFITEEVDSTLPAYLGNTLKLSDLTDDEVPVNLMGEKLKITISFEAVQAANKAYLSVFGSSDDTKGYYKGWI